MEMLSAHEDTVVAEENAGTCPTQDGGDTCVYLTSAGAGSPLISMQIILTPPCSVRAGCLALSLLCIMQLPPPVTHQERAIWGVTWYEEKTRPSHIRAQETLGPVRLEDGAPMAPKVYRSVHVSSTLWGPSS